MTETVPIFRALRVDREVIASLLQLRQLAEQSRQALALLRGLSSRIEQLPARGDDLARARRMALSHTFEILELAKSMQSTTVLAAATPTPGSRPLPNGPAGMGPDGTGNRTSEGAENPDAQGSGIASSITTPICRNDVAEPARVYAQATRQEVLASIGAIRAGLINVLITEEECAREILAILEQERAATDAAISLDD